MKIPLLLRVLCQDLQPESSVERDLDTGSRSSNKRGKGKGIREREVEMERRKVSELFTNGFTVGETVSNMTHDPQFTVPTDCHDTGVP